VHPIQSQRSFQKLFQSLHACISKQFVYVGWAGVDMMGPTADCKVNTSMIRLERGRMVEQLSIWDGEEVNTKSMRDVWPFRET